MGSRTEDVEKDQLLWRSFWGHRGKNRTQEPRKIATNLQGLSAEATVGQPGEVFTAGLDTVWSLKVHNEWRSDVPGLCFIQA